MTTTAEGRADPDISHNDQAKLDELLAQRLPDLSPDAREAFGPNGRLSRRKQLWTLQNRTNAAIEANELDRRQHLKAKARRANERRKARMAEVLRTGPLPHTPEELQAELAELDAELTQLGEERLRLKSRGRTLSRRRGVLMAALEVHAMPAEKRAALRQVIGAAGIGSGEAVGELNTEG